MIKLIFLDMMMEIHFTTRNNVLHLHYFRNWINVDLIKVEIARILQRIVVLSKC